MATQPQRTAAALQPTPAEQRVIAAAAAGAVCDFQVNDPAADDPAQAETWGTERALRADVLRALCLGLRADWPLDSRGVRVRGARIDGALDLEAATVAVPLLFSDCAFTDAPIVRDATLKVLNLDGSRLAGLEGDGLTVQSSLFLRGIHAQGEIRLLGAKIGGTLDCSGGSFENPRGKALSADRLTTGGDVFLISGFRAVGEVRLLGAKVGGDLACIGGNFENPEGVALYADGLTTGGCVFLRNGFRAVGEVRLLGAKVGVHLECDQGSFENAEGTALVASALAADGGVFLRNGFRAAGEVRLLGAKIGNDLDCGNGSFENPKDVALNADGLTTGGNVLLRDGFCVVGEVRLVGAKIGGTLECDRGSFESREGRTLSADGLTTSGHVFLRNGFCAVGEVRFLGARIGGDLTCIGGSFDNPGGVALGADGADIRGGLFWRQLTAPPAGCVSLAHATVGVLADDLESWPQPGALILNGFVYGAIAPASTTDAEKRLDWLRRQNPQHFSPQPYEQLAKVLRQMG
ncbi:MAG: hypothetical protein RKK15_05645, partial [Defluviicoccus sp.]|nr:hypothetical protein [Defluviicoccus sp.]